MGRVSRLRVAIITIICSNTIIRVDGGNANLDVFFLSLIVRGHVKNNIVLFEHNGTQCPHLGYNIVELVIKAFLTHTGLENCKIAGIIRVTDF